MNADERWNSGRIRIQHKGTKTQTKNTRGFELNRRDAKNAKRDAIRNPVNMSESREPSAVSRKRTKAVALLSGGLDSILACRMMMEQGIEVIAVNFTSPFCTCTSKGCRHQASKVANELGIELKLLPTGQEYIEMVKHPKHGRGSHMNPCIDCRIFTFTRARIFADEIGADFLFSGEVLGERPMSQHLRAMTQIEEKSGLKGRILRPLSAQLLDPTEPELKGLVDRSRLKSVQGRCRQPQLAMVKEYGMTDYPSPGRGLPAYRRAVRGPAEGCVQVWRGFGGRDAVPESRAALPAEERGQGHRGPERAREQPVARAGSGRRTGA